MVYKENQDQSRNNHNSCPINKLEVNLYSFQVSQAG